MRNNKLIQKGLLREKTLDVFENRMKIKEQEIKEEKKNVLKLMKNKPNNLKYLKTLGV